MPLQGRVLSRFNQFIFKLHISVAAPWVRRLVAGFSAWSLVFNTRSFHVGFVLDTVALGQVCFLPANHYSCGSFSFLAVILLSLPLPLPPSRALVPSDPLIGCEPIQVYDHRTWTRSVVDSVHHVINSGDYLLWAFPWRLKLWRFSFRAVWAIKPTLSPSW
jgi:hypothetical protein